MKLRLVCTLIPIVIAGCKTSDSNSSVESHRNPANQHRALAPIESGEAIRNLLSFGAAEGLYNGTNDDASLCKLETTTGEGHRYERYGFKISHRTGVSAGQLIVADEVLTDSNVKYERISQAQQGNTGNTRDFHRWVIQGRHGSFEIQECTYAGLSDFDFAILKDGQLVSCNKRHGPLFGWGPCRSDSN